MTAATGRRPLQTRLGEDAIPVLGGGPVKGGASWKQGWIIGKDATGNLVPYATALGLTSAGMAIDDVDASSASSGDLWARLYQQHVEMENGTAGDEFTSTDGPSAAYASDNQTACKTSGGGTRSIVGVFSHLDHESGKPIVWVGPAAHVAAQALANVASLASSGTFLCDEWTNSVAPDVAGLKTATATTVAPQTILAAALIAGGKTALSTYPRNVTFTTAGVDATHAPASAVITGTDIDDNALTETVTLSQSATTDQGVKAFKTITSIVYGAAGGTDATVSIGFGKKFGLSKSIASRAGRVAVVQEVAAGSVVTNGTIVAAASSAPHGTYAPNADPDGSKDFALTYEQAL